MPLTKQLFDDGAILEFSDILDGYLKKLHAIPKMRSELCVCCYCYTVLARSSVAKHNWNCACINYIMAEAHHHDVKGFIDDLKHT